MVGMMCGQESPLELLGWLRTHFSLIKIMQPASSLHIHHHSFPAAQASNPPDHQSTLNDLRPAHWVELSKTGDAYVLSKDGLSVGFSM